MLFKGVLLGLLMSQCTFAAETEIHLLGRFTYKGTPVSQAVILTDKRVTGLEQCRDFVRYQVRGTERGKNYYRHYIRAQRKGINIVTHYTCIETSLQVSRWNAHDFYDKVYLVDLRNGQRFTRYADTNSCWAAIRKDPDKHSRKLYCAKMNQTLSPAE
ncbi:hypothetical protein Q4508_09720 [Amphritea sp. 2_MG-2023]|jgi:hypothetical protein|uniref:hypothetical protein n=1 Tax=Amphritea TaxID=515417 RepID=UPI001C07975F|nr:MULTISPECIES: hypothetical protein [Amphritea]MBU2965051.1 hypothetical protein [Amphritea atlantica]MDO6418836.1 hypothetical protein [Amphritea sp. 2_MG-2023]